jgi:hypothetical protein
MLVTGYQITWWYHNPEGMRPLGLLLDARVMLKWIIKKMDQLYLPEYNAV